MPASSEGKRGPMEEGIGLEHIPFLFFVFFFGGEDATIKKKTCGFYLCIFVLLFQLLRGKKRGGEGGEREGGILPVDQKMVRLFVCNAAKEEEPLVLPILSII